MKSFYFKKYDVQALFLQNKSHLFAGLLALIFRPCPISAPLLIESFETDEEGMRYTSDAFNYQTDSVTENDYSNQTFDAIDATINSVNITNTTVII